MRIILRQPRPGRGEHETKIIPRRRPQTQVLPALFLRLIDAPPTGFMLYPVLSRGRKSTANDVMGPAGIDFAIGQDAPGQVCVQGFNKAQIRPSRTQNPAPRGVYVSTITKIIEAYAPRGSVHLQPPAIATADRVTGRVRSPAARENDILFDAVLFQHFEHGVGGDALELGALGRIGDRRVHHVLDDLAGVLALILGDRRQRRLSAKGIEDENDCRSLHHGLPGWRKS